MPLADNTRYVLLDDPAGGDASAAGGQVTILGDNDQVDIRYADIEGPTWRTAAQAEQLRQYDVTVSNANSNYSYWVTIVQDIGYGPQQFGPYTVETGSSPTKTSIRDDFIERINADANLEVTASSQTTDTFRLEGNTGFPDFKVHLETDLSGTENQAPQFPRGQGQDLIDMGLSDAESSNNYTRWDFTVFEKGPSASKHDYNTFAVNYVIFANEGGGTFSAFQTSMDDILEPDTAAKLELVSGRHQT